MLVVEGALQPAGRVTRTAPDDMPPAAAVYVRVTVLPVEPATNDVGAAPSVPVPSAARTVTDGDAPRLVIVLAATERWAPCHVCAPAVVGAVAPGPPPAVEP